MYTDLAGDILHQEILGEPQEPQENQNSTTENDFYTNPWEQNTLKDLCDRSSDLIPLFLREEDPEYWGYLQHKREIVHKAILDKINTDSNERFLAQLNLYDGTILMLFASLGDIEITRSIIARLNNIYQDNPSKVLGYINARDSVRDTVLIQAVENPRSSEELVRVLLEAGADINIRGWCGETAIERARSLGRTEMVKLLKDRPNSI